MSQEPVSVERAYMMGLHDGTKDRHYSLCPRSAILRGRTAQQLIGQDYADGDPAFVDDPRLDAYYQGYNAGHMALNHQLMAEGYDAARCPCGWKAEAEE